MDHPVYLFLVLLCDFNPGLKCKLSLFPASAARSSTYTITGSVRVFSSMKLHIKLFALNKSTVC